MWKSLHRILARTRKPICEKRRWQSVMHHVGRYATDWRYLFGTAIGFVDAFHSWGKEPFWIYVPGVLSVAALIVTTLVLLFPDQHSRLNGDQP
jgi:hypothetical protein